MVKVRMAAPVLQQNDEVAGENRELFNKKNVFVLNLMSSPGSGKTSILEKTIGKLSKLLKLGVIEGDIYTTRDAERIEKFGVPVVQINTDGACHLDARMVKPTLEDFDLDELDLLIVENVGNLVCPAEFDLGEDARAAVLSITEGNDKPVKYPLVFRQSKVVLLNKIDLLPYTDCEIELLEEDLKKINPELELFQVSARLDEGFAPWIAWLEEQVGLKKGS
ncbi:MAG: hydrogenase nickel incorporation protein HypB [Syntrophaceticus sp.]|jgi:hydrogenase nickel incorporation protein HypB|nr:hydrogenase nickel incorporation protein HypB [Syntrophaceticus sp.]MDD3314328.1 hydrogenase nickel incorporation protein HypB [Syntrophaceticus sp.]MDD4359132.1 hydrogenase nickel incorporation protein HypB [Syntrophaceticus sp.]MDD4782853.1 hydrogenase nickel incorporation protein HypB [Syntrophaceticus sp.]